MTDHLETLRCSHGATIFYWHFTAADGSSLVAVLPAIPDFSGLEEAKTQAVAAESGETSWP